MGAPLPLPLSTVYSASDLKYASTLCEQNSESSGIKVGGSERVHSAESHLTHSMTLLSNQSSVPSSYSIVKNRS